MTQVRITIRAVDDARELVVATWLEEQLRELHRRGGLVHADYIDPEGEIPSLRDGIKIEISTYQGEWS